MSALKNSKHEAFARAIVEGKTGAEAYAAAGYKAKPASAATNAGRTLKIADVSARIAELKAAAAADTVMSAREVLEELSAIGRGNIQNYLCRADDTGELLTSLRDLSPVHAAAIQEITVDTYTEGAGDDAREVKRVRFKLHDKRAALNDLGRYYKLFKDRDEPPAVTPVGGGAGVSLLELARRIAFALELGARAAVEQGSKTIAAGGAGELAAPIEVTKTEG